jgi:hypothetical protein
MEALITGGSVNIGKHLTIGNATDANFIQSGGNVYVYNDTFIGLNAPASGTLEITGGAFDTCSMWIHAGLVKIDGGNVNVLGDIQLATDPCREPNTTELQMKSGTLAIGNSLSVGPVVSAKFIQSGGNTDILSYTFLGINAPAAGTLEITGGTFDTGVMSLYDGQVVIGGSAAVGVRQNILVASEPNRGPSVPEFQVNNGALTVGTDLTVGCATNGKFTQSAGDVDVAAGTFLGHYAPASGTLKITGGDFDTATMWVHAGLVEIDGGNLNVTKALGLAPDPSRGPDVPEIQVKSGKLTVPSGGLFGIGYGNNGKLVQSGGEVLVNGNDVLYLGNYTPGCGTLQITGGTFDTGATWAHYGLIDIDGGDMAVTGTFGLACNPARDPNDVSEFQMNSGTFSATWLNIAHASNAKFVQSGGTVNGGGTTIGFYGPGSGTMEVTGGTFNADSITLSSGQIVVDGNSAVVNAAYDIHVSEVEGRDPNIVNELQIKNGTVTSGWNVGIGQNDDGQCILSGGNLFVNNGVILGCGESAVGQMEMSGGNLQANNIFLGGWGDATQGFWNMTGGDITLYDDNHGLMVSNQGSSTPEPNGTESVFTMDGGTIDTPVLIVGRKGTGKFLMSDGSVDISDRLWIGEHFDPCDGLYTGHEGLVELYGGQINVIGLLKVG